MENRENRLEIIIGARSLARPRKLKYIGKYWKFIEIYCDKFEFHCKLLLEQKVWVVPGNSIYWNMLEIYQNILEIVIGAEKVWPSIYIGIYKEHIKYIGNYYWREKSGWSLAISAGQTNCSTNPCQLITKSMSSYRKHPKLFPQSYLRIFSNKVILKLFSDFSFWAL